MEINLFTDLKKTPRFLSRMLRLLLLFIPGLKNSVGMNFTQIMRYRMKKNKSNKILKKVERPAIKSKVPGKKNYSKDKVSRNLTDAEEEEIYPNDLGRATQLRNHYESEKQFSQINKQKAKAGDKNKDPVTDL